MALDNLVVTLTLVINALACFAQYWVQQWEAKTGRIPPRHSIIPGTSQKFLYWQDFHTQTWGDLIGLGLMWVAFVHFVLPGGMEFPAFHHPLLAFISIFFSMAASGDTMFLTLCLGPTHKPDWGFPKRGKISWGGGVHLVYFGASFAMVMIIIFAMVASKLNYDQHILSIVGLAVYGAAFAGDTASGHFVPLKRTTADIED